MSIRSVIHSVTIDSVVMRIDMLNDQQFEPIKNS